MFNLSLSLSRTHSLHFPPLFLPNQNSKGWPIISEATASVCTQYPLGPICIRNIQSTTVIVTSDLDMAAGSFQGSVSFNQPRDTTNVVGYQLFAGSATQQGSKVAEIGLSSGPVTSVNVCNGLGSSDVTDLTSHVHVVPVHADGSLGYPTISLVVDKGLWTKIEQN